jgi:hypothetical protein
MKWEYKMIDLGDRRDEKSTEAQLNLFGSAGWELVAVVVQFTSHFAYLKRQIRQQP